jgi:hypothetical protein
MPTNQLTSRLLGLTAIILTLPASLARATTIVVARTANEIVIGADSKVTDTYGKELNSQVCKIQQVGDLFIVIAGFEGNRPVVFVRNFRTAFVASGIGVTVIPDDCLADCQGEVVTRFLGETDAIEGLPEDTPGFWKDGLVAGVRRLVETEIEARSEYVGPPIDLLRIDAHGATWIQKKKECADVKPLRRRISAPPRHRRR